MVVVEVVVVEVVVVEVVVVEVLVVEVLVVGVVEVVVVEGGRRRADAAGLRTTVTDAATATAAQRRTIVTARLRN